MITTELYSPMGRAVAQDLKIAKVALRDDPQLLEKIGMLARWRAATWMPLISGLRKLLSLPS